MGAANLHGSKICGCSRGSTTSFPNFDVSEGQFVLRVAGLKPVCTNAYRLSIIDVVSLNSNNETVGWRMRSESIGEMRELTLCNDCHLSVSASWGFRCYQCIFQWIYWQLLQTLRMNICCVLGHRVANCNYDRIFWTTNCCRLQSTRIQVAKHDCYQSADRNSKISLLN